MNSAKVLMLILNNVLSAFSIVAETTFLRKKSINKPRALEGKKGYIRFDNWYWYPQKDDWHHYDDYV